MSVPHHVPTPPATGAQDRVRCSVLATARGEWLAGSAPTMSAVLLLEERGPWGDKAWRDARLPEGLGAEVLARCARAGVRPLLMRRSAPGPADRVGRADRQVIIASTRPERPWLEEALVGDPREVLDLDLSALGAGRSLGLTPRLEPIFAVCVHGGHDACCADRGRPALDAFAAVEPEAAWGVSHLGGHRFAATALVLGEGLSYGRLDADSARLIAAEHRAGRLVLHHLRGRVGWPAPAQAAEIAVRQRAGFLLRRPAIRLLAVSESGPDVQTDQVVVTFAVDRAEAAGGGLDAADAPTSVWRARAIRRHGAPALMSCSASALEPAAQWDVVDIAADPW